MPYRTLLLTLFLGLTLAGCADNLNGGGHRSSYGPYDGPYEGPYDWTGNGRCDDPNYNISGFGDAWPGTDEYDCRRWGGGLRGSYYGWTTDRYYDWQRRDFEMRRREIEIRRRMEEQRRDRERAERHDRDHDGDRDRDRRRDWGQRDLSQRPGGDPVDRANRDMDDATRRQWQEQRRQQREQAMPNDGQRNDGQRNDWQRGGGEGRRNQDRQSPPPATPPAAADTEQHHPNLAPPPPPSTGEQHHPRNDMTERRQEN